MKITLIYPNLNGEFRPNLGLLYIATYLDDRTEHEPKIFDPTFRRKKWKYFLHQHLKKNKPDIIGFSCLSFNYIDALRIAKEIRDYDKEIPLLFGGIHASLTASEFIKNKLIDFLCIGEGEITLSEFLTKYEKNQDLKQVEGIWFKEQNKIIRNKPRILNENLDDLPFPNWDFYEIKKYMLNNPYQLDFLGSRGCPYNCSYCSNHALKKIYVGKYVRQRSPENIIEEINYNYDKYHKKGFRYAYFWDETFTLEKKKLHKFCNLFIKEKLHTKISWNCTSRADLLKKEDVELMSRANCNIIRMGVEAGDEHIRNDIFKRSMSLKEIYNARALCKAYNINNQLNFIFGGPEENMDTMQKTFQVIRDLQPEQISINTFQPIPCTQATEILKSSNSRINESKFKKTSNFYTKYSIESPYLSSNEVENFVRKVDLFVIENFVKTAFLEQKSRFIIDLIKFIVYYKPKYDFYWHDAYKFMIRKYIYEKNLKSL